ncbi:MAG TPA: hypothetical protein VF666_08745 [Pyrinomonadaceae bacterium]|jgi:hypothetical protein
MWSRRLSLVASVAGYAASAIFLFVVMSDTVTAQQTSPGAPRTAPASRDPFSAARDRRQREAMLRGAEIRSKEATNPQDIQAAIEQVKQDFKRIQILRNWIVRHLKSNEPLNYKIISDGAGEIHKRAGRLKEFLVPPNPEADAAEKIPKNHVEFSNEQMKDALATLCIRIDSFTENPIFKVSGVVDAEQSAKAGRDLESIIQISEGIKKSAERLHKTPKQ